MTQADFHHLLASIDALSPDQMRQLICELEVRMVAIGTAQPPAQPIAEESAPPAEPDASHEEIQRRLFNAGLLSETKPPIRDLTPYRDRKAVPVRGEPLSETVIRERR